MRQGNGSDLLGLKDPHSTKIGIIYVALNDDRKSVLAAILTQEKLGRKQIAIVLPENQQNKAFQHPQDFDDLKAVQRKLRAHLIFIAPAGPGPAEFARQRRFSVYSSLESYADALRAESLFAETHKKRKKGRFFDFGRKTIPLAETAAGSATAPALSSEKGQLVSIANPASNSKIAENAPNHPPSSYADLPTPQSYRDNDSALPASEVDQVPSTTVTDTKDTASSSTTRSAAAAAGGVAAGIAAVELINKSAQRSVSSDVSSASKEDDWDALPPTTPLVSSSQKHVPAASVALNATPPLPPSSMPNTPDPAVAAGPSIIELPSSPKATPSRSTGKLPAMGAAGTATNTVQPSATPLSRTPSQQGSTGKTAVVTGAAAAASVAHGTGASRPPVRGGKPTQTGAAGRKRSLGGLIAAILIVALLLLCGGVASSASGLQLFHFGLPIVGNTAPATVTITPYSKVEQDSYVIQAVTGNADSTRRQVSLRQLTFSPQKQSKPVTATGVGHIPAKAATGQLTFYNGSNQAFVVGATTAIPGPNSVSVETDGPANIPAAHPPTEGIITVNAHAITAGANGNMAAGAINETCCASGGFITVVSSAFAGGQDEKDYTFLQQSDVDGFVNQLKPTLSQQALSGLKAQVKSNEQLVGDPQCATQPNADQSVGDQGHNIVSANVTVNATCTGLAYDASGAQTLAQNLLKSKAVSDLGQGYALAGTIITKQTVTDVSNGVVTLQVAVAGTWYYQFDDKQKQTLANQLANKTRAAAQGFLNPYKGIAKAKIDIANGGDSLPSDPKQISIMVLAVSGASPANLPALPAVEPTSLLSTSKGRG